MRLSAPLTALLLAVASAGTLISPAQAYDPTPLTTEEPAVQGPYLSAPPPVPGTVTGSQESEPGPAAEPTPAPTEGHVVGRVVSASGRALSGVMVQGIRYSDLGPGINFFNEQPVLARTRSDGRFRLPQLTERYLIRVCDAPEDALQCPTDPQFKRFMPTYVGPDGVTASWLPQTRLFRPLTPTRSLGTIRVQRSAVLTGTLADGPERSVRLLRRDGTLADRARTDEAGRFRFEVAPGRYRVEVDRHEGLRTVATVPGFRSRLLTLTTRRATKLNAATKPAAVVHGRVSVDGAPAEDQFLVFTDTKRRFAAGVVTGPDGRYTVESLRPGTYRISSTSMFAPYAPTSIVIRASLSAPVRADLELSRGATVSFSTVDRGGPGAIDAELRDSAGRAVKMYRGNPSEEDGGVAAFGGLAPGTYQLALRRASDPFDDEEQTEFPWAVRTVEVRGTETTALGAITLDRPTMNLSGSIPRGSQVKFTTIPADRFLRPSFIEGANATGMTVNWTEQADSAGRYLSRGVVPGRYAVTVTARYLNPENAPSTYAGNIAATHHRVTVADEPAPTANFTAPEGGIVRGKMRYAGTQRPLIAPVGLEVLDGGDQSWLFPTVSSPQRYARGFRVDRLHAGTATGRLLDLQALLDRSEESSTAVPQTLLASARLSEWGTPYWLDAPTRRIEVVAGEVTDVGWIDVKLRR
jgi:hypothetical protein